MSLKHKTAGVELSKDEWEAEDMHEIDGQDASEVIIPSLPPTQKKRVKNIYYDQDADDLYFEVED